MTPPKPNPSSAAAPSGAPSPAPAKAPGPPAQGGLGPEHAELGKCIGTWDVAVTFWGKEGKPTGTSTGRSVFTAVFDGRFIREDFSGSFMGKPFTGVGIMGYDRAAGHYVSVWYDSVGTGIMHSTAVAGLGDEDLVFEGVGTSQETMTEQTIRHILRWESDARFTVSFFKGELEGGGEDEVQTMELVYNRQR